MALQTLQNTPEKIVRKRVETRLPLLHGNTFVAFIHTCAYVAVEVSCSVFDYHVSFFHTEM